MLVKTISYTDFAGVEKTKDLYFHLGKVDVLKLQYSVGAGKSYLDELTRLIEEKDYGAIIASIEEVLLLSYGELSSDNEHFVKDSEKTKLFRNSPMFDTIFFEFLEDPSKFMDFFKGILPKEYRDKVQDVDFKQLTTQVLAPAD